MERFAAGMPMLKPAFDRDLLILLFGLAIACFLATGDDQFVFSGFTQSSLILDGTAIVTPAGLLDLSNGTNYLKGHAFYPTPLHFRNSSNGKVRSFSVSFVFSIVNTYPALSDDGMAFFISPSTNFAAATSGMFFGLLRGGSNGNASNRVVAVELDTFQNSELQDINDNHVGVDINGVSSLVARAAGFYDGGGAASSFKNLTLNSGSAMQVWVDYDGESTRISVSLAPLSVAKPSRPLLSATHDLSAVLQEPSYVGFSATAGPINVRDYVLGWSLGINRQAPSIDITKLPKLPRTGSKARSRVLEITLPVGTAMLVLAIGTVVALLVQRRRRYAEVREDWEAEYGPHRFSYKDLFHATRGFKKRGLLGAGGFGKVYKGVLPRSNVDVAVKSMSHESRQGMKEFISEIVSIGRLRHRNLVQLLGYCRRKGELFLVYDYMPNGSLDKYLHCKENSPTLSWSQRLRVIKGIASGLLYLHEKWEKVVIHRDIKASNVLLDGEMNGRLGDFGLARLYDHGTDPQTTHMVGTMGYLAPELVRSGKASPKSDVFAFGMFLLEVTCGKKPVRQITEQDQVFLVDWVLEHWNNGSIAKTVDSRILADYDAEEACTVLKLGLLCLHPSPSSRPSMREVMQYLDGDMPLPELRPTQLSVDMVAMVRNNGFNPAVMSYPQLMSSFGTMSDLSGGR